MSIFWIFHRMYLFLYPIYFSKIFLLKQRERISLLDRLEQIWRWTHLEFWEKIEDNAEFVLSSASVSYFGHNLLLKIPIDSELMFFWKEIQFCITFIEIEKFKFQRFLTKNVIQVTAEDNDVFFLRIFFFSFFFF